MTDANHTPFTAEVEKELNAIYSSLDTYFRSGDFKTVDHILSTVDFEHTSTVSLVGYASATLPAKDKLVYRPAYLAKLTAHLKAHNEDPELILHGLI